MIKLPSLLSSDSEEYWIAETILLLKRVKKDEPEILENEEIEWAESHTGFSWDYTKEEKTYLVNEAKLFATKAHEGQFRKSEHEPPEPAISHAAGVVEILKSLNVTDEFILAAAWLHDVLEDTDTTYDFLKHKFNKTIADIVFKLTSDKKEIKKTSKGEYLLHKIMNMENNVLSIKLADRLHNIKSSLNMPTFKRGYHKETKYILKTYRPLTAVHKKLVFSIETLMEG